MTLELLAPAGGPAAFKAALAAGADAIYCSFSDSLNARRFAEGFTPERFEAYVHDAHIAGVRVFVTVNVIIKEEEMELALALVRDAYKAGADAFIVQDWGLVTRIHELWPEIEIHVSTQSNVHDVRGVAWARDVMGAKRVTLSRELTTKEIVACASTGVDVECFGHGAICFCYSGLCHMSSYFGGRSANRGLCAQPCRLPHELIDQRGNLVAPASKERLLCPRDLRTMELIDRYIDAGVASLKIEGRMKAPDYVHSVVSAYRGAVDDALAKRLPAVGEDAHRRRLLARAFNRGFTSSYLDGHSGNEMMSYERSNNRGELVGKVVASRELEDRISSHERKNGKTRLRRHTQAELTIQLSEPVGEKDLLEIRPDDDPSLFFTTLAPRAYESKEEFTIIGVRTAPAGSKVRLIRSQVALDAAKLADSAKYPRKRPITVYVYAHIGKPCILELTTDDGVSVRTKGFIVEQAKTKRITQEELIEHVGRMGDSAFTPTGFEVDLDKDAGMSFSALHKLRAQACELLEEALLREYSERSNKQMQIEPSVHERSSAPTQEPELCVLVATQEQALSARQLGIQRIYIHGDAMLGHTQLKGMIPWLDEICREQDHKRIDPLIQQAHEVVVNNVSELTYAQQQNVPAEIGPAIPVHNAAATQALYQAGAYACWLSPELSLKEISSFSANSSLVLGITISGRQRLMTSEHCVLAAAGSCTECCDQCTMRSRELFLRNIDGHVLPVKTDIHGRSRIYAASELDTTPQIPDLIQAGVSRFLVDVSLLDEQATLAAIERATAALRAYRNHTRIAKRKENSTSGHLFAPIG